MVRVAVIPAAGEGLRAAPLTENMPEVLLDMAGRSLLVRNIELIHQTMGIDRFVIITGFMANYVRETIINEAPRTVTLEFVECTDPARGLAKGLLEVQNLVREPFVTVLGDELYLNSAHHTLLEGWRESYGAVIGIRRAESPDLIEKNYSVERLGSRVRALVEKPTSSTSEWMGVGSYVFSPEVFDFIESTPTSPRTGRVELTEVIDRMARQKEVHAIDVGGQYFNVNTTADVREARLFLRSQRLEKSRISVVIPALNEALSIAQVVNDFRDHVHEVLVVDNQSTDGTAEVARQAGARVESVQVGGYGEAIRHGFDRAEGDILMVVEADHSFRAKDIGKFVEYLRDADMVIGTRTTCQLIEQGTNMRGLVRIANIMVGTLLAWLWPRSGARFSDVGCTYRAIWREEYGRLRNRLTTPGPEFSTEMMVEALRSGRQIVEIPVSYYPRKSGESKHSKTFFKLSRTASRMLSIMFKRRFFGGS